MFESLKQLVQGRSKSAVRRRFDEFLALNVQGMIAWRAGNRRPRTSSDPLSRPSGRSAMPKR
jgi:hypothetical protein